jgi:hypothetical protein
LNPQHQEMIEEKKAPEKQQKFNIKSKNNKRKETPN